MLSRSLRRALLDPRYSIPPTFLLPWTAGLSTSAIASETTSSSAPLPPQQPQTSSHPRATTTASFPPNSQTLPPSSKAANGGSSSRSISSTHDTSSPVQISQSVKDLLPVLRAQRQIYISAHIYGKSYLVTEGDTVRLPFVVQDAEPGDVLRLNRALYLGSRDLTLKPAAPLPKFGKESPVEQTSAEITLSETTQSEQHRERTAPHFIPHLAKDKHSYLDERLYVCRATVTGVESEPMRVLEKTKRRQRHVKHVKSKHRYTMLKISELRVRSLEELENGSID